MKRSDAAADGHDQDRTMATPKPTWWADTANGAAWQYASAAAAYVHRPPYQDTARDLLLRLLGQEPRVVLDLGCGTGALARLLAPHVDRVDAVDIAATMVSAGQRLPAGTHPHLRWILGAAEDAPLAPPYGLVTAGASLHWMDWDRLLPRLQQLLTPQGRLVILDEVVAPVPWQDELSRLIQRYSLVRAFVPLDLVDELVQRGLFELEGRQRTDPLRFRQPLAAYVASFHARSSMVRERMGEAAAAAFDAELRTLVRRHVDRDVELAVAADVAWGRPRPSRTPFRDRKLD